MRDADKTIRPRGERLSLMLATGFGLGLSPFAPGTMGALLGVALTLVCKRLPGLGWELAAAMALCALAIPICDRAEKILGGKDDRRIVADEYMTFPICMLGLPATWPVLAVAFVTNRLCDIVKPPPAAGLQALKGGWGIVADDAVSSLYSLALNHGIFWVAGLALAHWG